MSKQCDHTADTISQSMNVNPPTVSKDRTRPLLNNSGHCLGNRTGSRLGLQIQLSQVIQRHQIPQMSSFLPVLVTEPGLFQPTLATVRRIAQDPIWRMKS